mmetsp:Transcript_26067/g.56549  ORF Transcript_26067/g.56549 Transcript_26067/m.56549 type:complete len:234 (+) Transcript_26067:289-990(+)
MRKRRELGSEKSIGQKRIERLRQQQDDRHRIKSHLLFLAALLDFSVLVATAGQHVAWGFWSQRPPLRKNCCSSWCLNSPHCLSRRARESPTDATSGEHGYGLPPAANAWQTDPPRRCGLDPLMSIGQELGRRHCHRVSGMLRLSSNFSLGSICHSLCPTPSARSRFLVSTWRACSTLLEDPRPPGSTGRSCLARSACPDSLEPTSAPNHQGGLQLSSSEPESPPASFQDSEVA